MPLCGFFGSQADVLDEGAQGGDELFEDGVDASLGHARPPGFG